MAVGVGWVVVGVGWERVGLRRRGIIVRRREGGRVSSTRGMERERGRETVSDLLTVSFCVLVGCWCEVKQSQLIEYRSGSEGVEFASTTDLMFASVSFVSLFFSSFLSLGHFLINHFADF